MIVNINGVDRGFRFGMYTLKVISQDTGVSNITEVFQKLKDFDSVFVPSFLFACAKAYCVTEKKEIDFTEIDVCDWSDSIGLAKTNEIMEDLIRVYSKNMTAPETGQESQ